VDLCRPTFRFLHYNAVSNLDCTASHDSMAYEERPVRTREHMLRHIVSVQSCLMCLDKSQRVPQQISSADTCARLSVERWQHEETSKDLS
jgi:hypothetical protein